MSGVDLAVIDNQHVAWDLLTTSEQAVLTANFPRQAGIDPPAPDVTGDDVDPRFEKWLDQSYYLRHVNDNIGEDPFA